MRVEVTPDVLAFSADQVSRLTGLTLRQLGYWDKTEFFSPEYAPGYRSGPFSRIYSFRDVVGLFTIAMLRRKKYRFPLQTLRRVGAYLHAHSRTPWASLIILVAGREILFRDPNDPDVVLSAIKPDQRVITIQMEEVARRVEIRARVLRRRRVSQIGRIERKRYLVHNSPVLAGTRVPTSAVWNLHEAGYTPDAIIQEFPRLRAGDVDAALAFERQQHQRRHRAG